MLDTPVIITQPEAEQLLRTFEENIARSGGYEQADKRQLSHAFSEIIRQFSHPNADHQQRDAAIALEAQWRKDRESAETHWGADTIASTLQMLRSKFIPALPAKRPPTKPQYFPPMFPQAQVDPKAVDAAVERTLQAHGILG